MKENQTTLKENLNKISNFLPNTAFTNTYLKYLKYTIK